jgi:hypothetical protein
MLYPTTRGQKELILYPHSESTVPFLKQTKLYYTVLKFIVQQMSTPDTRFYKLCFSDVTNGNLHYTGHVLALHACKSKVPQLT